MYVHIFDADIVAMWNIQASDDIEVPHSIGIVADVLASEAKKCYIEFIAVRLMDKTM
jgi:hypothetical protein